MAAAMTSQSDKSYTEREILAFTDMLDSSEEIQVVLDGRGCLFCGRSGGPLVPIGFGPRGQVFAHSEERDCDDA